MTRREEIIEALNLLGGHGTLKEIYEKVAEITDKEMPKSFEAVIRGELEKNSSDSDAYNGRHDTFCLYSEKGRGEWALRNPYS